MSPAGFFHDKMHSLNYCNIKNPIPSPDPFWGDTQHQHTSVNLPSGIPLPYVYKTDLVALFSSDRTIFCVLFCLFIPRAVIPKLTVVSNQPPAQQWKQSGHFPGQHRLYDGNNLKVPWNKNDKTTDKKIKTLILMSPLAQGLIPPKSAVCSTFLPPSQVLPSLMPAAEKENKTMPWKQHQSESLHLKWDFLYHFFKSAAEFEMNAYAKCLGRAQLGAL